MNTKHLQVYSQLRYHEKDSFDPTLKGKIDEPTPHLPWNWQTNISLFPLDEFAIAYEIDDLHRLSALRLNVDTYRMIHEENAPSNNIFIRRFSDALNVQLSSKTGTSELLSLAERNSSAPIFYFKNKFDVARPYHYQGGTTNFFDKPILHPSFPSGHATQSFLMALLLGKVCPATYQRDLLATAFDIARNREIAGVHFRSDTFGGLALARQLVEMLTTTSDFKLLLDKARKEWP